MKRYHKEKIQSLFHHYLANSLSYLLLFKSVLSINKNKKIECLLTSLRYNGKNQLSLAKLAKYKKHGSLNNIDKVDAEYGSIERRVIELSEPLYHEDNLLKKGVLLISFTSSFKIFLNLDNFEALNEKYLFILEPSWTGYADIDILCFCERASDLVIQATDIDDRALIQTMYPSVGVIDIGASNWVNQRKFSDLKINEKTWDLLYVANNNPVKRVFRFIEVVENLVKVKPDVSVRVLCAGWGGSADEVFEVIEKKKLDKNIKITDGVSQTELLEIYNKSKISVLFSLKEGSNRVLFESMACNTPVFCLAENKGVNKSYINESTGMLSYDSTCEESLLYMIDNYKVYSSREWALNNLSPQIATARLKSMIEAKYQGRINTNLKVKINNPEVEFL